MNVEREINQIMKKYELSREEIAVRLMVSYESVYRWSKGQTAPKSLFILRGIADLKQKLEKKKKS